MGQNSNISEIRDKMEQSNEVEMEIVVDAPSTAATPLAVAEAKPVLRQSTIYELSRSEVRAKRIAAYLEYQDFNSNPSRTKGLSYEVRSKRNSENCSKLLKADADWAAWRDGPKAMSVTDFDELCDTDRKRLDRLELEQSSLLAQLANASKPRSAIGSKYRDDEKKKTKEMLDTVLRSIGCRGTGTLRSPKSSSSSVLRSMLMSMTSRTGNNKRNRQTDQETEMFEGWTVIGSSNKSRRIGSNSTVGGLREMRKDEYRKLLNDLRRC